MVFDDENCCESRRVHMDFDQQKTSGLFPKKDPKRESKESHFALIDNQETICQRLCQRQCQSQRHQ